MENASEQPASQTVDVSVSIQKTGSGDNMNRYALFTALGLIAITLSLFFGFVKAYNTFSDQSNYVAVYWDSGTDSINLLPGPNWFLYDSKVDSIKSLKAINNEEKQALLKFIFFLIILMQSTIKAAFSIH